MDERYNFFYIWEKKYRNIFKLNQKGKKAKIIFYDFGKFLFSIPYYFCFFFSFVIFDTILYYLLYDLFYFFTPSYLYFLTFFPPFLPIYCSGAIY